MRTFKRIALALVVLTGCGFVAVTELRVSSRERLCAQLGYARIHSTRLLNSVTCTGHPANPTRPFELSIH